MFPSIDGAFNSCVLERKRDCPGGRTVTPAVATAGAGWRDLRLAAALARHIPPWAIRAGQATPSSHVPSGGPNGRREATFGRPPPRDGRRNGSAKPPPRPECPGMAGFGRGKKETAPGNDPPALGDRLPPAATGHRVPPWARRSGRGANGASGARNRPRGDTGRFGAAGTTPRQGSARTKMSGEWQDLAGEKRNGRGSGGSFRAVDGIGSRHCPRFRELDGAARATPASTYCRQDCPQPPEWAPRRTLQRLAAPGRPPGRVGRRPRRTASCGPVLSTANPSRVGPLPESRSGV